MDYADKYENGTLRNHARDYVYSKVHHNNSVHEERYVAVTGAPSENELPTNALENVALK